MITDKIHNNKPLVESIFSLSVLNGLTVLLPLVTLPYILRVVGAANYGIYSYVYVLIQYLLLLNAYGFNFSATKQIAQHRDELDVVNKIYNAVIACRLILFVVGVVFFMALSPWLLETPTQKLMFVMGFGVVLGETFNPIWLFQGMEKMRYLTIVNVFSKLIFTILIFVLIRTADDYIYIILFNSCGFLLAGVLSLIIARKQFHISFALPTWADIKFQFKDGLPLFGSTVGINLYSNANVFILKFFVGDAALGVYSAAEKVMKGLQMLTSPISQALFPHLGHDFKDKPLLENLNRLKKVSWIYAAIVAFMAICGFCFADVLVTVICGKEFIDAVAIVRIMSIVVLVGGMNYLLGVVGLINLNCQTYFLRAVLIAGVASISFLLLTAHSMGIQAGAWAMSLSECVLFTLVMIKLVKLDKQNNAIRKCE